MEASRKPPPKRRNAAVAFLLVGYSLMIFWISYVNSPNLDEVAHLPSGLCHWRFAQFELYRVNPPLVRMVAAIPILLTDAQANWSAWHADSPYSRSEFALGREFVMQNGLRSFWYFTL